jgi:hypothetical protein
MPFLPDKGNRAMLSTEQINDLHRLYWSERWPIRKIERHLHMGWHTIRKYLDAPAQGPAQRPRTSKLDPFKATIAEWLEKDATVTGTVIHERLRPLGYTGANGTVATRINSIPWPSFDRATFLTSCNIEMPELAYTHTHRS